MVFTGECNALGTELNLCNFSVIRASVPKLLLDDVFEQKNEIARAVEEELEKVCIRSQGENKILRCS